MISLLDSTATKLVIYIIVIVHLGMLYDSSGASATRLKNKWWILVQYILTTSSTSANPSSIQACYNFELLGEPKYSLSDSGNNSQTSFFLLKDTRAKQSTY